MMEDNGAHFFEGTEKLLEVWFSRQDESKGTGDLRTIPRFVKPTVECIRCRVSPQQHNVNGSTDPSYSSVYSWSVTNICVTCYNCFFPDIVSSLLLVH